MKKPCSELFRASSWVCHDSANETNISVSDVLPVLPKFAATKLLSQNYPKIPISLQLSETTSQQQKLRFLVTF